MKDITAFEKLVLKKFGITFQYYALPKDRKFMHDAALRLKAHTCICLRGEVDFYFDKNGKFVGSCTQSRHSWEKR